MTKHGVSGKQEPATPIQKVASMWLGIINNDSTLDLGQLANLLDGEEIKFKTADDGGLFLDVDHYPNSLPYSIARATLRLSDLSSALQPFREELKGIASTANKVIAILIDPAAQFTESSRKPGRKGIGPIHL